MLFRLGSGLAVCRMLHSTGWPPKADKVERPSEAGDAGSVDLSYWDLTALCDAPDVWTHSGAIDAVDDARTSRVAGELASVG